MTLPAALLAEINDLLSSPPLLALNARTLGGYPAADVIDTHGQGYGSAWVVNPHPAFPPWYGIRADD